MNAAAEMTFHSFHTLQPAEQPASLPPSKFPRNTVLSGLIIPACRHSTTNFTVSTP